MEVHFLMATPKKILPFQNSNQKTRGIKKNRTPKNKKTYFCISDPLTRKNLITTIFQNIRFSREIRSKLSELFEIRLKILTDLKKILHSMSKPGRI